MNKIIEEYIIYKLQIINPNDQTLMRLFAEVSSATKCDMKFKEGDVVSVKIEVIPKEALK